MKKATRKQIKRHNQQLVLRALYEDVADNRAALAQETGLTKPTISNIITELMEKGFVEDGGQGESTASGGKRPRLLHFVPTARQIIALTVNSEQVLGCLAYLDGNIVARHHIAVNGSDDILLLMQYVINGLIAQQDSPLLCLTVGVSGIVDNAAGVVIASPALGWSNFPLGAELQKCYDTPIYIGNNTEFATRAQVANSDEANALVTVFLGDTIEVGSTFDGTSYQHGGDIAALTVPTESSVVASLEWRNVVRRLEVLLEHHPETTLTLDDLSYLHIKRAIFLNEPAAVALLDEISSTLAYIYGWILALMRPREIALAGSMSLLGKMLIGAVTEKLNAKLSLHHTRLTLAQADNLSLQGAIVSALNKELGIV